MELKTKLAILADAAKYDASCASSGSAKRDSVNGRGIGSSEGMGICHSYTPDGRCVSLLKILLTNFCIYDCLYCINRASSNIRRARFWVEEVVRLTLGFYARNYIEGLFLSSGIIQNPDYTMSELVRIARVLREEHDFRGYIHLKTIPNADPLLLTEAGFYADRLSVNIELSEEAALANLAPDKNIGQIRRSMGHLTTQIDGHQSQIKQSKNVGKNHKSYTRNDGPARSRSRFAPAGQSTQMIIGADKSTDTSILKTSSSLYGTYKLRRVYYSAFSPIPDASKFLPVKSAPLRRENRLYQADWLMRFYGFEIDEIMGGGRDDMLDLDIDPKLAWALKNRASFPLDVNQAEREQLLRVPGLGTRTVDRLLSARRVRPLILDDLSRLKVSIAKVMPFLILADHRPTRLLDRLDLSRHMRSLNPEQLALPLSF